MIGHVSVITLFQPVITTYNCSVLRMHYNIMTVVNMAKMSRNILCYPQVMFIIRPTQPYWTDIWQYIIKDTILTEKKTNE